MRSTNMRSFRCVLTSRPPGTRVLNDKDPLSTLLPAVVSRHPRWQYIPCNFKEQHIRYFCRRERADVHTQAPTLLFLNEDCQALTLEPQWTVTSSLHPQASQGAHPEIFRSTRTLGPWPQSYMRHLFNNAWLRVAFNIAASGRGAVVSDTCFGRPCFPQIDPAIASCKAVGCRPD